MIHNLMGTGAMPWPLQKEILLLKDQFKTQGGRDEDFPAYLEQQGVRMVGPLMITTDEFDTYLSLKQQK